MIELLIEFLQEILAAFVRALHDDHAELPKILPLLFARVGPVICVILPELSHDRRFAVAVMTDLRALHFEEIVQGVFAVRLLRVSDAEHRIGGDSAFQVRLLPIEFQFVLQAEFLERGVEERDLKLVVESPLGMFVEGLGERP